jgi:hypothetical protein
MVCLIPTTDSIEAIPFTDDEVTDLNEILADDDEEITVQPINLEHVFNNETSDSDSEGDEDESDSDSDSEEEECDENLLEDVYFPILTTVQLQNLAASAYHDTDPSALSSVIDPIAFDFDVTSDSIKNELICFHKDLNWE